MEHSWAPEVHAPLSCPSLSRCCPQFPCSECEWSTLFSSSIISGFSNLSLQQSGLA